MYLGIKNEDLAVLCPFCLEDLPRRLECRIPPAIICGLKLVANGEEAAPRKPFGSKRFKRSKMPQALTGISSGSSLDACFEPGLEPVSSLDPRFEPGAADSLDPLFAATSSLDPLLTRP